MSDYIENTRISLFAESKRIKMAIEKVADDRIKEKTNACVRLFKATVTTAANSSAIGVKLISDNTELTLPFSTDASKLSVGDVCWVQTFYGNFRNASVITYGDYLHTSTNSSGVSIVQTTGSSTTSVMSQNAVTTELNDKVPQRLTVFSSTSGFRQNGTIYVDNGTAGFRMSLEAVKDLNTKISTTDNISDVDFNQITIDDYIYLKKE